MKIEQINIGTDFPAPVFPETPVDKSVWRNGIAVRMPNWLGDVVMALPALRQLSQMKPKECALFVIVPEILQSFFASLDFIDGIFTLKHLHRRWTLSEINMLRQMRIGVGVLFNNSLRDAVMMKLAGIGELYGSNARGRGFLMKRAFEFPRNIRGKYAKLHHTNKYLAIAYAMGAPRWTGELPPVNIKTRAAEIAPELSPFCRHSNLMALGCGATYGAAKRWDSLNFRAVAEYHIANGGIVALLGTESEKPICDEIMTGLPPNKAFNLAGKTRLDELMLILSNAKVAVANDSGVMHLAALLNVPGIAVFGSTDYSATAPINKNWYILRSDKTPCAPCFKRVCPHGNASCMKEISASDVISVLKTM